MESVIREFDEADLTEVVRFGLAALYGCTVPPVPPVVSTSSNVNDPDGSVVAVAVFEDGESP